MNSEIDENRAALDRIAGAMRAAPLGSRESTFEATRDAITTELQRAHERGAAMVAVAELREAGPMVCEIRLDGIEGVKDAAEAAANAVERLAAAFDKLRSLGANAA